MQTAKDIMTRNVITVSPDTDITQATKILLEHRINGLPVLDADGKLVGIVCQSDMIAQQKRIPLPSLFTLLDGYISLTSAKHFEKEVQKIAATRVAQAMTADPLTIQPGTSLEEIASLMVGKKLHTLPVVDNGVLVGVVGKEDMLRTLMGAPANS
ncbi:MAG: CBS domain-containing protein [Desulfobacterales bacterium]|jgi:CBS-domain-containing membrane protein